MADTRDKWIRFETLLLEMHYEHLFKKARVRDCSMADIIRELIEADMYETKEAQSVTSN